jgi:hypothetical protein
MPGDRLVRLRIGLLRCWCGGARRRQQLHFSNPVDAGRASLLRNKVEPELLLHDTGQEAVMLELSAASSLYSAA